MVTTQVAVAGAGMRRLVGNKFSDVVSLILGYLYRHLQPEMHHLQATAVTESVLIELKGDRGKT